MNLNYNKQISNSDKDEHDAYLKLRKDAQLENATNNSDDSGKETSKSFNSGEKEKEMAKKFDSNTLPVPLAMGDIDGNEKRKQLKKAL